MRRHSFGIAWIIAVLMAGQLWCSPARAQDNTEASLGEKLRGQYKLVKLGADSTGLKVIDAGTVLVVHGKSVFGTPPANLGMCTASFQDGNLHPPTSLCTS